MRDTDSTGTDPKGSAMPLHSSLSMDESELEFQDEYEDEHDDNDDVNSDANTNGTRTTVSTGPLALRSTNVPSLTAAICASGTTGGTTYAFGLYASALKHTLHLSQSELDTISSAFFCAGLLSWAPGLVVDRRGPKFGTAVGGFMGALSLLCYWVVATGAVPVPRSLVVTALSILGIATYVSSALVTGSVFKIIVSTTGPGTKGTAVGAAKGYVGLGSGAYACIFESIRQPGGGVTSDLNFLPMAAFFAASAASVPALCLLPPKERMASIGKADATSGYHFKVVYGGLVGLGIIVVGTSILSLYEESSASKHNHGHGDFGVNEVAFSDEEHGMEEVFVDVAAGGLGQSYAVATLIVLMWFGPILSMLCLPRKLRHTSAPTETHDMEEGGRRNIESIGQEKDKLLQRKGRIEQQEGGDSFGVDNDDADDDRSADETGGASDGEEQLIRSGRSGERAERSLQSSAKPPVDDLTLTQMLRTTSSWLLLWTCTILAGGGTVITNNLGQMVEALRLDPTTSSASLALFSAAQAASRVLTGAISESALSWSCRLPRPAFLVLASFGGCAAHLLLATATTEIAFVVGVALSGAAFGMIWPLMVLIVGEVFGTAHVGANYMFYDGVTSAIGTLVLSKFVAQEVYESHIVKHNDDDGFTCYGDACFELSHYIIAGLSMTCVLSSLLLMYKTSHIYE